MERFILIAFAFVLTLTGCNNNKGELQKIAKQELESIGQKVKKLDGSYTTKEVISNDSLCIYSFAIKYPNSSDLNGEQYYIRIRNGNVYDYYENSRVYILEKSIVEEVLGNGSMTVEIFNGDKETKESITKQLWRAVYKDCINNGKRIQNIK